MPARLPAAGQAELRQRARQQEAFRPDVRAGASQRRRGPVLPSATGLRRAPASVPRLGVRSAGSECQQGRAWHREPATVIPQPEGACRDVRRAVVRRGGQQAARRACCQAPALRSVQVLPLVQVLPSARPRQDGPQAQPAMERASPLGVPQVPLALLPVASERDAQRAELQPEAASVCAAARPEAAKLAYAAVEPQPEAATAASERLAARAVV